MLRADAAIAGAFLQALVLLDLSLEQLLGMRGHTANAGGEKWLGGWWRGRGDPVGEDWGATVGWGAGAGAADTSGKKKFGGRGSGGVIQWVKMGEGGGRRVVWAAAAAEARCIFCVKMVLLDSSGPLSSESESSEPARDSLSESGAKGLNSTPERVRRPVMGIDGDGDLCGMRRGVKPEEEAIPVPGALKLSSSNEDAPVPAFVHRVSNHRRRQYVEELHLEPPSPIKCMRRAALAPAEEGTRTLFMDTPSFDGFTMDSERYELGFDDYDEPVRAPPSDVRPPRTVKPSDQSLRDWHAKPDSYLNTLLRCDGACDCKGAQCPGCGTRTPEFRCSDCFGDILYCAECIVNTHCENPLHRIAKWHGYYFVKVSLAALGLRVQLGHPPGEHCTGLRLPPPTSSCCIPTASTKSQWIFADARGPTIMECMKSSCCMRAGFLPHIGCDTGGTAGATLSHRTRDP
ncbi:hypothetical protein B0H13DRAFT_1902671 [Mycena leptocephala]|nr:hypothetical protein B0H13DRAFT_1902671 [Mycena leptocephala]